MCYSYCFAFWIFVCCLFVFYLCSLWVWGPKLKSEFLFLKDSSFEVGTDMLIWFTFTSTWKNQAYESSFYPLCAIATKRLTEPEGKW